MDSLQMKKRQPVARNRRRQTAPNDYADSPRQPRSPADPAAILHGDTLYPPAEHELPRATALRHVGQPIADLAETDKELFPIRTVSSLTGVNSITLRAWERRYGLVRPLRTPSGHRLYRRDEIDLIHRVVALLDKGIAISQVQRALGQPGQPDLPTHAIEDRPWVRLRRRMHAAITRFDEDALEDIYHEALGIASVQQITHQLLVPLLDEVRQRQQSAEGSLAEELFFNVYLQHKLAIRFQYRTRGVTGPRLLGACLPGEHQDIGLLLFALTAQEIGMRWILLGTDVPLDMLKIAIARKDCDAVVLFGSKQPQAMVLTEQLRQLAAGISVPVFVCGAASIYHRDQIVAAGAVPLGNDLTAGAKRIADILNAAQC